MPQPNIGTYKYPVDKMDIGDSFFVDEPDIRVVCGNVYHAGNRLKMKFATRKVAERGVPGVRVWRIA